METKKKLFSLVLSLLLFLMVTAEFSVVNTDGKYGLDERLVPYIHSFAAFEICNGEKIVIPNCWVDRYFSYVDGDNSETQVYLNIGWIDQNQYCDEEIHIGMGIFGNDFFNQTHYKINVEMARMGANEFHVLFNNTEIAVFYPNTDEGYGYYGFNV